MAQSDLSGPIGRPLNRVDGPLKVTGKATYAFEYAAQGEAAYGFIVSAAIGKGRVIGVDVRDAERALGVLLVLTQDNAPPQAPWGPVDLPDRFARAEPALNTDAVRYFGFPVAFVVAETFEQARAAAALVRIRYAPASGEYDLHAAAPQAENPGKIDGGAPADTAVGDFAAAFAAAPVKIDAAYTTPYQHSAPMEPHASMAFWEGEMLTVCTAAQLTTSPREGLARTLNIPPENVRIITRYIGGGFGNKLPYYVDATLAAIGARMLRRPVKVAMTRPQVFNTTTHRSASEQRVRLGAGRDGRLTAYGQDAVVQSARFDTFTEPVALAARSLYAAPNRLTRHRRARLDLPRSDSMRAPGDAIGLLALECAMDELAEPLALDPVELRLRNDTQIEPELHKPFSSRHLAECLREGASRFGWDRRVAKPASVRDGPWLVGLGVASAIRGDLLKNASARARLESDGRLTVELAMTDIGTGSYTILTQIAAEAMELPVDRVAVRLGDTSFPPTDGSGGSWGAATSGAAVLAACRKLKAALGSGIREAEGSVTPAELDICGAGAAVINAIYNATGARIRDFPATPDKLLAALEALDG